MANVSVAVANWVQVTRTVDASTRQHGEAVAEGVRAKLHPDDGAGAELRQIIDAMRARLGADLEALRQRDIDLAVERADDAPARATRDQRIAELRAAVIRAGLLVSGAFGSETLAAAGLSGATPIAGDLLAHYADAAAVSLRGLTPPEAFGGGNVDTAVVADQLATGAAAVRDALGEVKREEREEQGARAARDEAEAKLRRTYAFVADSFSAMAFYAGLDAVAERVRPTARRRAGLPEAIDTDTGEPTVTPDAPSPSPDEA